MKKRISYFLLFGWMSVMCFVPLQAAQERGFFAALFDISARYFSELSSLSQVSISQQVAALREKKIVLASDQKKQNYLYKKLIRSIQRANRSFRAKALQAVAYLKTEAGKRTAYEVAVLSMISGVGYKLWLQNGQTQAQFAALHATMNQIKDDTTRNEAAALHRDHTMGADIRALAASVQAVQHDVRQKTDDARTAFQVLAQEIRSNYYDSDDSSDEELDEGDADDRPHRKPEGCSLQ